MEKSLFKLRTGLVVFGLGFVMPVSFSNAAEPQKTPDTPTFAQGAKMWAENCARCHNMRDPKDFRNDQWHVIVTHMRTRAGLTGTEARGVLKFLQGSTGYEITQAAHTVGATPDSRGAGRMPPGQSIYEGTCIACHGSDGQGAIPGVPDFTDPAGRLTQSDDVLRKHVREGFQSPGSPMAMPPGGGNQDLTDQNISDVLSYLRATFKR
ncbi:MAG: c-type cytochrome [Rhodocyclaceae bacterium]|nr:c-type cytochrome [Rhodocyclaceae bacterium]